MMINKRLINLCSESKKFIVLTVLCNVVAIICNILIVFFIGRTVNTIFLFGTLSETDLLSIKNILYIVMLLGIRFMANIMQAKFSHKSSANARITLRNLIYNKLLKLGFSYEKAESSAGIMQISIDGVEQLEIYFGKYLPQFFYAVITPVILFIFISRISIKSAVVFIICVPLIPLSIIAIMKIAKKILKEYWNNYANLGGTFLDNLQGLTTLKVYDMDEERHEKMNVEAEGFRKITMKVLSMQLNSINIMDIIAFGGAALGTIMAITEFRRMDIFAGDLLIIILLSAEFFIPLRLLGSYFHIAMNGMTASDRIFNLLDYNEEDCTDSTIKKELKDINIKFENVDFSYDGKRKILNNINLDLKKGEFTAIVGESGSGKSTIASLIMNFNNVDSGKIMINDDDIKTLSKDSLYDSVSLVSTNSYIFNGTILDNLIMADENAGNKTINAALKKAKLDEFVASLEEGLFTNVGEGGSRLSGGQKQRLALARAIIADREMIIFDEATSNIDVESEEAIWNAIYEISRNKTVLVISHRLANVEKADNIYVLKDGSIVESGNHEVLMNNKSEYYKMYDNQKKLESIREVS